MLQRPLASSTHTSSIQTVIISNLQHRIYRIQIPRRLRRRHDLTRLEPDTLFLPADKFELAIMLPLHHPLLITHQLPLLTDERLIRLMILHDQLMALLDLGGVDDFLGPVLAGTR